MSALLALSGAPLHALQAVAAELDAPEAGAQLDVASNEISYSFASLVNKPSDITTKLNWSDEGFRTPSVGHTALAEQSMALAMTAGYSDLVTSYAQQGGNVRSYLEQAGFHDVTPSSKYNVEPTTDSIGFVMAWKDVVDMEGKSARVYAVGVRMHGYGAEWGGNLKVGSSGPHEGFALAADQINAELKAYVAAHAPAAGARAKLWYAGYSRAGSACNLAAAQATREANGFFGDVSLAPTDIYAYCFEAPQATDDPAARSEAYDNITNFVNIDDWIGGVFGKLFGMERYGRDYSYDATTPSVDAWKSRQAEVRADFERELAPIAPGKTYDASSFRAYNSVLAGGVYEGYTGTQGEYLDEAASWLKEALGISDRASYVKEYQDDFVNVAQWFVVGALSRGPEMLKLIDSAVMQDEFIAKSGLEGSTLSELLSKNSMISLGIACAPLITAPSDGSPDKLVELLQRVLRRVVDGLGQSATDEQIQSLSKHMAPFMRKLVASAIASPSVAVTILNGADSIFSAHMPEVSLAWLRACAARQGGAVDGWQRVGDAWVYNEGGKARTGWLSWQGSWYWLGDDGVMRTGWALVDGSWYWLGDSGALYSGWLWRNGAWYYLDERHGGSYGAMCTGWQLVNGAWYYLDASGAMLHDTWVGGYHLASDGRWDNA
jgi:hypothetical protein